MLDAAGTRAFLRGRVRVLEKLDGLNVGLFFTPKLSLRFLSREHGALEPARLGPGLWPLIDFAFSRVPALLGLLGSRFVLYGEWLGGPRRLPYPKRPSDFVGFDLFDRRTGRFLRSAEVERRARAVGLVTAPVLASGRVDLTALQRLSRRSRYGGSAEGVVVERVDGRKAKWVRSDWARRPLVAPEWKAPAARWAPGRGVVTKAFPHERAADADVELAMLQALPPRLGPSLRRVEIEPDGVTLQLSRVAGRAPRRITPEQAAWLGAQLRRLHGVRAPDLPRLPGGPLQHLKRAGVREPLRRFLAAQPLARSAGGEVPCHGDLKPENVLVQKRGVALVDFERACLADPAWELACAMDRLGLDANARLALLRGYGARDTELVVRTHLFRLAWDAVLPRAIASLQGDTGRRPTATAKRLAREAAQRTRRTVLALGRHPR